MTDNPGLDVEEYRKQLAHLDPVTRKQLEEGDWDPDTAGPPREPVDRGDTAGVGQPRQSP